MGLTEATADTDASFSPDAEAGTATASCPLEDIEVALLWQEYHKDAPTTQYQGAGNDDKRVVENPDADGNLQAKPRLHLCFLEKAVTTMAVNVIRGTFHGWWRIVDDGDNLIKEHPDYKKSNYDSTAGAAQMRTGRFGMFWDGRNKDAHPVYVTAGSYRSLLTVKRADGTECEYEAAIELEGDPYRTWIVGQPKSNAELDQEFNRTELNQRLLHTNGERISTDCWIKTQRGAQDDGHVVFLGQGTIEAYKAEGSPNYGAIATPHGVEFKGWVRRDPHATESKADRVQLEDVGRTDGIIQLTNAGGPSPTNPYNSGSASKAGVQTHGGSATDWTSDGLSVGCTTVKTLSRATVQGEVRSNQSSFGNWGDDSSEDIAVEGPKFVNKQTKRSRVEDALLGDEHSAALLHPPAHPAPASGPPQVDEPLHMQPTLQQAAFGGLKGHEIPQLGAVADEPVNKLRIRVALENYASGSKYYVYHHALVFGHDWDLVSGGHRVTIWLPRQIMRDWNGQRRNVLVKGHCQIAWYIERRTGEGAPEIVHRFSPATGAAGSYGALPDSFLGRKQETWGSVGASPGTYASVFKYKLQLLPYSVAHDVWVPEAAATDLFSDHTANLAGETLVTDAANQFVEGRSELEIVVPIAGDFPLNMDAVPV